MAKKNSKKVHSNKTPNKALETKRIPAGFQRDRLVVADKDPDYVYRIVNDSHNGSNVRRYLDGGYEFVPKEDANLIDKQTEHTPHDSTKAVDVGGGLQAYTMRIKKELYESDQELKQKEQDEVMASIEHRSEQENSKYINYKIKTNKTEVTRGKRRSS